MRWGDPVRRKGTTLRSSRGHCTSASAVQQSRDRSASSLRGMLASVVLRPVLNKRDPRSFTPLCKASLNSFVQRALCPVSPKPDQSVFSIVVGMPHLFNPTHLG